MDYICTVMCSLSESFTLQVTLTFCQGQFMVQRFAQGHLGMQVEQAMEPQTFLIQSYPQYWYSSTTHLLNQINSSKNIVAQVILPHTIILFST